MPVRVRLYDRGRSELTCDLLQMVDFCSTSAVGRKQPSKLDHSSPATIEYKGHLTVHEPPRSLIQELRPRETLDCEHSMHVSGRHRCFVRCQRRLGGEEAWHDLQLGRRPIRTRAAAGSGRS
jgi:hypothetical protein